MTMVACDFNDVGFGAVDGWVRFDLPEQVRHPGDHGRTVVRRITPAPVTAGVMEPKYLEPGPVVVRIEVRGTPRLLGPFLIDVPEVGPVNMGPLLVVGQAPTTTPAQLIRAAVDAWFLQHPSSVLDPTIVEAAVSAYLLANPPDGVVDEEVIATAVAAWLVANPPDGTIPLGGDPGDVLTRTATATGWAAGNAHTHPVVAIQDSGMTGRSVVEANDPLTARTVIGAVAENDPRFDDPPVSFATWFENQLAG